MHIADINSLAVLVAAAAFFAIGYLIHLQLVEKDFERGVFVTST
jgi:hypothetical protein